MPEDEKPEPKPAFQTAEQATDFQKRETQPTPGLSQSPGLRTLPDSKVPGFGGGGMISHVVGPQQAPVDPIAAGLDTNHDPMTRQENRVVTQTGVIGAGPRPSTYAEKDAPIVQAALSDGSLVPAPADLQVAPPPGKSPEDLKPASEAVPQHKIPDGAQRSAPDEDPPEKAPAPPPEKRDDLAENPDAEPAPEPTEMTKLKEPPKPTIAPTAPEPPKAAQAPEPPEPPAAETAPRPVIFP